MASTISRALQQYSLLLPSLIRWLTVKTTRRGFTEQAWFNKFDFDPLVQRYFFALMLESSSLTDTKQKARN